MVFFQVPLPAPAELERWRRRGGGWRDGRRLESKVVGYFAYYSPTQVVCCTDVDACVVSGFFNAMKKYLAELDPERASRATVKKTRFGEIRRGLELGAAYAFDRESYERFYPLAVEVGIPVAAPDFDEQSGRFFTVRLV